MPVRKVERIQKVELVRYVPGSAKVGRGRNMAAVHGTRKRIVANVGAGGAPKKVFVVTKYVCIAGRITDARRQVQVVPVI